MVLVSKGAKSKFRDTVNAGCSCYCLNKQIQSQALVDTLQDCQCFLCVLETMSYDFRHRRRHELIFSQSFREIVMVYHRPNLVMYQRVSTDEASTNTVSLGLDPQRDGTGQICENGLKHNEMPRGRFWHWVADHGQSFVSLARGKNVKTLVGRTVANGHGTSYCPAIKSVLYVADDSATSVVKSLCCTKTFDQIKVARRACGNDLVPSSHSDLNRIAPDAG